MRKVLNTIVIVMLALGLMGIILGISVGLYRNDILAKMQTAKDSDSLSDDQFNLEQFKVNDLESGESQTQHGTIMERLLWGNLHTAFLGIGTLLTVISVILLLIGMRNSLQGIIR